MRFFNGQRLINIVFSRESYSSYRQRMNFVNRFVLPLVLLGLLVIFFLFQNSEKIGPTEFLAFTALAALGFSGVLQYRLTRERAARKSAQDKANFNSTRLLNIYNSGLIGVLYTRFDGVITEANDTFLDMIRYSRSDLERGLISWVAMTPPEYAEVSRQALDQLRQQGHCAPFSKEYFTKDGERVHVLLGSSLLNGLDRAEILTYAIDITNLKDAEEREAALSIKMRHQQDEIFRVLNRAPVAIVIRKGPDLEVEYANQTALDYTPFTEKQALGSSADEFHSKLKSGIDTAPLKRVYHTGQNASGRAEYVRFDRAGDGNLVEGWFDYLWEPTFDEKGNVNGVATFTFDVSDLARANSLIKANEQHFRFVADAIPHKMWTSGPDGIATYYNKGWKEYLGEEDIEILRVKAWESIHPEELAYAKQVWTDAVTRGDDIEIEQRIRRHDGIFQWHLTRVCACRDDAGHVTMYVGSSTNIHEQKMASIALRLSNEKKDEFLNVATHELRTPITSMKAALQTMERAALPDKSLSLISLANRQVNRLTQIINDLTDVAKIQEGKLLLNSGVFLLSHSVKEIVAEFQAQKTACTIDIHIHHEVPVIADKNRIDQVIANLLSNAVKYSSDNTVIQVDLDIIENSLRCTVSDHGIGIPADLQPFIFDRFFVSILLHSCFRGSGLDSSSPPKLSNSTAAASGLKVKKAKAPVSGSISRY